MATQLSGELDIASRVRAVSSWSRVASMDSNQKTTSTWEGRGWSQGGEHHPAHRAPARGSPGTPVSRPNTVSPVTPAQENHLLTPNPLALGASAHTWGGGQEASASTGVPPVQEGQMPTLSSLTGYSDG